MAGCQALRHRSSQGCQIVGKSDKTCLIRPIAAKAPRLLEKGGGNCSPSSSRFFSLGVSLAQKAKVSGHERPRLCTSKRMPPTLLSFLVRFSFGLPGNPAVADDEFRGASVLFSVNCRLRRFLGEPPIENVFHRSSEEANRVKKTEFQKRKINSILEAHGAKWRLKKRVFYKCARSYPIGS